VSAWARSPTRPRRASTTSVGATPTGHCARASLYTTRRVWTAPALDQLSRRLARAVEAPDGTFARRWAAALRRVDAQVAQLAVEAMIVHLAFPADLTPGTKERLVAETVACHPEVAPPPAWVVRALAAGVAPTGVAFKLARLSQLRFIVEAARAWKARPAAERRGGIDDPDRFKAWLDGLPARGARSQREALAHLVHPDRFAPIVSVTMKRRLGVE
jgi:5-methylcytosine-specific restriction enzyme B